MSKETKTSNVKAIPTDIQKNIQVTGSRSGGRQTCYHLVCFVVVKIHNGS